MNGSCATLLLPAMLVLQPTAPVQENGLSEGYLRETIEKLPPGKDRGEVIALLDRCRAVSDKFVQAVASGDAAAGHALLARDAKAEVTVAQWSALVSSMAAPYGAVTGLEYRNQAIEISNKESDSAEAWSTVWYAAKVSSPGKASPFAVVKGVVEEDGGCLVGKYELRSYGDDIPPWIAAPRQQGPRR